MAWVIDFTPSICSILAAAISAIANPTSSTWPFTAPSCVRTCSLSATPRAELSSDRSISPAVCRADSALRMASERTSSATTAKPRPASPARAASTAALSASRFVWNAIASIVLRILAVPSALERISAIAVESSSMRCTPSRVTVRVRSMEASARSALVAFSRVRVSRSCRLPETSCSVAACVALPSASDWLPAESWPAAPETWIVACSTSESAPASCATASLSAPFSLRNSPPSSRTMRADRSRAATCCSAAEAACSGPATAARVSFRPRASSWYAPANRGASAR